MDSESLVTESGLEIRNCKPIRLTEIWKLDRRANTVVALGLGGVVRLNEVASEIWLNLDGTHTVEAISRRIAAAYPTEDRSAVEVDVMCFVNQLLKDRLVALDWHPL